MVSSLTAKGDQIARLGRNRHVFVIPQYKVLFVSLAKNACTTMKWVVAELAGEDLDKFKSGLKPLTNVDDRVHNRRMFKNALRANELDPAVRADIHPDNDWFVFAIVRDPRARLFSAWQDKLLLQDPAYRRYRNAQWYPQLPDDADGIVADFARFVDAMSAQPDLRLHRDSHFTAQTNLLQQDKVPYTRIYPIEQMGTLRTDLLDHVQRHGWSGPLEFRRTHDTPLRANAAVFASGVREKVEALYAPDFEAFGELWDFGRIEAAADWTPEAVREAQLRAALGARLGEVRDIALQYRTRYRKTQARAAKLEAGLGKARRQARRGASASASAVERRPAARLRRIASRIRRRLAPPRR